MKYKIRKVIIGIFVVSFAFIFKLSNISAASCKINVTAPSSVVVGKSFNVTVTVSGSAAIGSWEYTLSYDSSMVKLNSGQLRIVDYGNGSKKSASYSYSFTSLKSGTATFKPVNASVLDYASTNECLASTGSDSVVMKTQAEIEESYSRNNNLGSLSVEGTTLSPSFDPNVTEYSATLPVDTTKAKIVATAQDATASISGAGELDVVDGLNKIEIVVTAQHGEKKTYTIDLTVEELDPIKVKVNGVNYTVVRKSGQVENIPVGFTESKLTIEEQEVVSYKSDIAKLTLLALKDEEGDIKLFLYDEKSKEFQTFYEAKTLGLNLIILDNEKDVSGFIKTEFNYNNVKVNGYKVDGGKDDNYYLVYAQNLETGSKGFYLYDSRESTFQRYFSELDDIRLEDIKIREYIIIGFLGLFGLIVLIKIFRSFASKERKIKRYQKKIAKLKKEQKDEYYYEIGDIKVNDKPEVKKIEEDEFVLPKKTRKQKREELIKTKEKLDKDKVNIRRVSLEEDED